MQSRSQIVASALFCLAILWSCSGPAMPSRPYEGLARTYEPGSPGFDAQVQPAFEGTRRGLQVDVSTPVLTLVFSRSSIGLTARIEWLVRLLRADGRQVVAERTRRETIQKGNDDVPTLFRRSSYSTFLEAAPGRYVVEVFLEDLSSGKTERKELIFDLPSRNQPLIATDIKLESQAGRPLVELYLPESPESRQAVMYLTGNVQRPVLLHFSVVRLDTDMGVAQSPFWQGPGTGFSALNPPPPSVLDTLVTENRAVERGPLKRVSFSIPPVGKGTYRAEIEIEDLQYEGAPPAASLSRYFIVRRPNFPLIEGYDELIPPLIYLADASEWEELETFRETPSARDRFDAFWGRSMKDRSVASSVVHAYFSRVEEANLRYSGFKEGWKTDRGMVFIILGEPLFIERTLDSEIWYYSYDEGRGERAFVFNRIWRDDIPHVIDELLLDRSFEFERFWRGEITRWRSGAIS